MDPKETLDKQVPGGNVMKLTWMSGDEEHDADVEMPIEEDDEMDDMPPLVDNPGGGAMTYTFISADISETSATMGVTADFPTASGPYSEFKVNLDRNLADAPRGRTSLLPSEPYHPHLPDDSGYIPRPPNAFILFRSAFIRSEKITGKVEGNHSTLSKIIGMCWHQLSSSERADWEAKAKIAQEEHRRRYPNWRFSPNSNASANAARRGRKGRGGFIASDSRGRGARRKCRDAGGVGDPDKVDLDPKGGGTGTPRRTSRKRRIGQQDNEDGEDEVPGRAGEAKSDRAEETTHTRTGLTSRSKGKGKARAPPQITLSIPDASNISPSFFTFSSDPSFASGSGLASTSMSSTSGSSSSMWRTASPLTSPSAHRPRTSGSTSAYQSASESVSVIPPQSSGSLSPYPVSVSPSPSISTTPPSTSPVSATSSHSPSADIGGASIGPSTPDHSDHSAISEPERNVSNGANITTHSRRPRSSTVPTSTSSAIAEPASSSRNGYVKKKKSREKRAEGRGRWNSNPAVPDSIREDSITNDSSTAHHSNAAPLHNPTSNSTPSAPPISQLGRIPLPSRVSSGSVDESVSDRNDVGQSDGSHPTKDDVDKVEKEREQQRNERRIKHIAALLHSGMLGLELEHAMDKWDEDEDRKMAEGYNDQGDTQSQGWDTAGRKRSVSPETRPEEGPDRTGKSPGVTEENNKNRRSRMVSQTSNPTFPADFSTSEDSDTDTETLRGRGGGDWSFSRYSPIAEPSTFQSHTQEVQEVLPQEQERLSVPNIQHMNSLPAENNLPLTHMFKRSLSEPASGARTPFPVSTGESDPVDDQEGAADVNINVDSLGTHRMNMRSSDRARGVEENMPVDINAAIWPPPSSPLPAHAASVPDPRNRTQAMPSNTRAYTHPDLPSQAHHRPPLHHSSSAIISQPYAPFASSPLSLSPNSGSPLNFSTVSSFPPTPSSAYQYSAVRFPPYSEQTYAPEGRGSNQSQQVSHLHYDYPVHSHPYTPGLQGPGQAGGPTPVAAGYQYPHSHRYHAISPSPQPPPSPELQQEEESRFSTSHPSHFAFPRRGSIAFPIGLSPSTTRSLSVSDNTLGSAGRHRRSLTWQQVRREHPSDGDTGQLEGHNSSVSVPTVEPGVVIDASQAKYEYSPVRIEDLRSTENMGYIADNVQNLSTSSLDQTLLVDDDSQSMQWSSASHGRVGIVNVVMDPYMKHNFNSFEQGQRQKEGFLPSTYSSLRGWAGESGTFLYDEDQSTFNIPSTAAPLNNEDFRRAYGEHERAVTGYAAFTGKLDGFQPLSVGQPESNFSGELGDEPKGDSTFRGDTNWRRL